MSVFNSPGEQQFLCRVVKQGMEIAMQNNVAYQIDQQGGKVYSEFEHVVGILSGSSTCRHMNKAGVLKENISN